MQIYINGEMREVAEELTAAELVSELGLGGRRIAMEINREIVPRSAYHSVRLRAQDRVEIVHAIGGG